MRFDDLDTKMRVYETAHDHCVMPGIYMVARLDGNNFTRLTKEVHKFEAPYDERFRDMMADTVEHLLTFGFNIVYGYAQSDEISLLFHLREEAHNRKTRKLDSLLAGHASAKFSMLLNDIACFDSRICQLPNAELVVDYFRWRQEDAHGNALNSHCYWLLRKQGQPVKQATAYLVKKSVAEKNELLFQNGINFNNLPAWHRRGYGFYWETYEKIGRNPITNEDVPSQRRRLKRDFELPMKDEYGQFIKELVEKASQ
jgi:tRNA(His) guanylyltransferase